MEDKASTREKTSDDKSARDDAAQAAEAAARALADAAEADSTSGIPPGLLDGK
ncbi:hypothetical protein [Streptomyces sp. NPDC051563]|uniref:hypothetical protein n=1 Tax=Streptomyces sp. NPDC051563 TaxID=3365659 RepID=UPI0037AB1DDF